MNTEIRQAIQQGFLLVTPTRRLARSLQQQHTFEQLSAGQKVWETPDILPWAAWIIRTWDDFAAQQKNAPLLLNSQQQQWLWQQIVSESSFAEGLLQPAAAAAKANDAWKMSQQWRLELFPDDLWLNKDALAFKSWATAFQQQCENNNWLDAASIEANLLNNVTTWAAHSAVKLCLVGFDELTPIQEALLHALQQTDCEIIYCQQQPATQQNIDVSVTTYADKRQEIKAVAHWAREQLNNNASGNQSIGIVVPELESLRSEIVNIFDDVLMPGNLFAEGGEANSWRPYNVSLGLPLASYPVINDAFAILALDSKTVALEDFGALLRSPFLAGAETEMIARAELDAELREQGEPEIFLNILQQRLEKDALKKADAKDNSGSTDCPQLIASLKQWREIFQSLPGKQNCTAWIQSFIALLNAFGWPGERQRLSHSQNQGSEYQTIEAWRELLDQFASLDMVVGKITYQSALLQLQRLAREQTYQVETGEVPIQVMGLLEAAGMQFDQLWVLGLHEEIWPSPARANPFLPIKLQRQQNLPHASAERELEYARRIMDRLLVSANNIIFSTPLSEAGRELRVSPLLKSLPLVARQQTQEINYAASIFTSRKIEYLQDEQAPKVDDAQASGGTGLFKDQAACPFRAFARHRLGARSLNVPEIGLDAMERGLLVHDCLQLFWERNHTHKQLHEMSDGALALNINHCVSKVINRFQAQRPFTATERFMQIEQSRLKTLLREWLSLERQRQSFTVIEREQKHICLIKGLRIQTRLDRVDELPDGSLVVIDYKTGKVNFASWMDERPDDPQLPLYAVTAEGHISAVVFAQIRRGEMKFVGLAEDENDDHENSAGIPGVKPLAKSRINKNYADWQILFDFWKQNLDTLALAFINGDARVDPYKANTCDYCDLGTLCRINELSQTQDKFPEELSGDENGQST